jgi:hypothetical protein
MIGPMTSRRTWLRAVPASIVLSALLAAVAIACTGDAPAPAATPPSASTATPRPTTELALSVAVGAAIPSIVTQVIAAVIADDAAALGKLVDYQQVGCTTAVGMGGAPKCRPGDAAGTLYRVFPTGRCEGEWIQDAQPLLDTLVQRSGALYMAARVTAPTPDPEPYWPKGDVLIYSRGIAGEPGTYFVIGGEHVLRAHRVCDLQGQAEADALIEKLGGTEYLIPPAVN